MLLMYSNFNLHSTNGSEKILQNTLEVMIRMRYKKKEK